MHFDENIIKQKLLATPNLVGVGHLFGPQTRSGRAWAQCPSGSVVTHFQGDFIKLKL